MKTITTSGILREGGRLEPSTPTARVKNKTTANFGVIAFLLLSFFSVSLPSGYIGNIPLKHVVYLITLVTLGLSIVHERKQLSIEFLLLVFSSLIFITFFIIVGILKDAARLSQVVQEATFFLTALTLVFMFYIIVKCSLLRIESFIIAVFWGNLVFVIWKTAIVLALVKGWISYDHVYYLFYKYLNYKIVSSGITGGLVRINFIIYDYLTVIMLFAVLTYRQLFSKIPKLIVNLFIVLAIGSIALAFSRYLFGVAALLLIFPFLFYSKFRTKLIVLFALTMLVYFEFNLISAALEQRFSSQLNAGSDFARNGQISALIDVWSTSPLLGGGFGYFAKSFIRDPLVPFSYEVQWLGFLAKFGLVGISYLLFLCGLLAMQIVTPFKHWSQLVVLLSFVLFLAGGFTNQYLVSSASGVIYCLHLALAYYASQQSSTKPAEPEQLPERYSEV